MSPKIALWAVFSVLLCLPFPSLAQEATEKEKKSLEIKKTETQTAAPDATNTSPPAAIGGSDACSKPSRADRLSVLAKVVSDSEAELSKDPNCIKDLKIRDRIGTFAAGTMSDKTPFVSIDRSCWAYFYGAQQKLIEGDDTGAAEDAHFWKDCLVAVFPDRVSIAQPYYSCFQSSKSAPPVKEPQKDPAQ